MNDCRRLEKQKTFPPLSTKSQRKEKHQVPIVFAFCEKFKLRARAIQLFRRRQFTLKIKNRLLVSLSYFYEQLEGRELGVVWADLEDSVGGKNPYLVEYSLGCRSKAFAFHLSTFRFIKKTHLIKVNIFFSILFPSENLLEIDEFWESKSSRTGS